jgi:hypothetical protein
LRQPSRATRWTRPETLYLNAQPAPVANPGPDWRKLACSVPVSEPPGCAAWSPCYGRRPGSAHLTAGPTGHPYKAVIRRLVPEGDTVVGRFTCSATHLGEWRGHAPTGRRFERVDEVAIFRLPDGRIAEAWSLEDSLSRLLQLASSTARLRGGGSSPPPVRTLPIQEVVPGLRRGPFPTSLKRPRPHPPLPRPVLSGEAAPWRGPDHRRYGRQRGD